jgi:F-type H+-transporting ATPase subunit epsilon
MADLHFELVTPDRLVMSDDVYMVVVPGTEGQSGIMAGHAPYMTTLKNGDVAIYRTQSGQPERIAVTGGFAEVSDKGPDDRYGRFRRRLAIVDRRADPCGRQSLHRHHRDQSALVVLDGATGRPTGGAA